MVSRKKKILSFVITALGLLALFLVAVNTGSLKVTPLELFKGLFIEYNENVATIYDLRFPRILIAIFGGAATAVSGVLLQAVMKNPLADPGIIGVSSGASLTAVLITAFVPTLYFFTPLFAFLGGMIAFLLVYSLSWKGGLSPLRIILVGVAVNAMFTGLMSAFNSGTGSNYSGVASIVNANITMKTWDDVQTLVPYVIIGLILSLLFGGKCNLLSLEDKTARSLGVNVNAMRIVISLIAVLLASIARGCMPMPGWLLPVRTGRRYSSPGWKRRRLAPCRYHDRQKEGFSPPCGTGIAAGSDRHSPGSVRSWLLRNPGCRPLDENPCTNHHRRRRPGILCCPKYPVPGGGIPSTCGGSLVFREGCRSIPGYSNPQGISRCS